MCDYDFVAEYAKSGRAACTKCKAKIAQDALRLGKMVQSPRFDGRVPQWFHVECFFDGKQCAGLTSIDMVHGKDAIRWEDREGLVKKIEGSQPDCAVAAVEGGPSGRKRKAPDQKNPEGNALQPAMKEQNALLWDLKDQLKKHVSTGEMRRMLEHNSQESKGWVPSCQTCANWCMLLLIFCNWTGSQPTLINRCADGMAFGALPACPECGGRLRVGNGAYACTGSTEWAKCAWQADAVTMTPWCIPDDLRSNEYLATYAYTPRTRVLARTELAQLDRHAALDDALPLHGMVIALAGMKVCVCVCFVLPAPNYTIFTPAQSKQAQLKQMIADMGGKCTSTLASATHLVTTADDVKAAKAKVQQAQRANIPILSDAFVEETHKERAPQDKAKFLLFGAVDTANNAACAPENKTVKVMVKGRAALDPGIDAAVQQAYHVLEEGDTIWDCVLNMTDLVRGNNTYYGLQLLEHDTQPNAYILFRKWGRIGTAIGSTKSDTFTSRNAAQNQFKRVFADKTGMVSCLSILLQSHGGLLGRQPVGEPPRL